MSRRERPDPRVAAVRARDRRRGRERVDAFRDDERRRGRAGGNARTRAARARSRHRPSRCRSARGSRRRAGASRASRSRPRRAAGPVRSGSEPVPRRRSTSQRSRGAAPREPARAERRRAPPARRPRRARRSGRRPCSRGRAASGVGSPRPRPASALRTERSSTPCASSGAGRARRTRRPGPRAPTAGNALDRLRRRPVGGDRHAREHAGEHRRGDRRARAPRRAPRSRGDAGAATRARRRSGRSSRAGPPPPRYAVVFDAVPADRHRAPARRAVARRSKKSQPQLSFRQAFMPPPGPRRLRLDDDRGDRGERPDAPVACGRQARGRRPRPARAGASTPASAASKRARSGSSGASPVVFSSASARRPVPQLARGDERVRVDALVRPEQPAALAATPRARAGVASSSCAKSGISVLTKSWTRSSGGGAGARPPGWKPSRSTASTVARDRRCATPANGVSGVYDTSSAVCRCCPALHAVHRPPGRLPRVVRRARPERRLVRDDPRVPADLLRALRVPEEVRVVALLPDEHEVGRGHEHGDERAALRGARERIGLHAEPAARGRRRRRPATAPRRRPRARSSRMAAPGRSSGSTSATIATCRNRPRATPRSCSRAAGSTASCSSSAS